MTDNGRLERLAELAITVGANVQPGQVVSLSCEPGKEPIVRALAAAAYQHGAKFVDVSYFDLHVKRARIQYAAEEDLEFTPPWIAERLLHLSEMRAARVATSGPVAPGLLSDLDPRRVGRDPLPFVPEAIQVVNERTTNWTIVPFPSPPWAALVYPGVAPDEALERLWRDVEHVCRLDEDDPLEQWRMRADALDAAAARMTDAHFDSLRFEGPGTDLTVGLLPTSRWIGARMDTVDGISHVANIPTEEVFTAPDPERVDGFVRATKPLVTGGNVVRGLSVRFEGGRAVEITAEEGGEVLAALTERDDGAKRLGELALVDREGRIGPLDRVFYDTLLDENAASHVALGAAYEVCVGDADKGGINTSAIHIDFMIGGNDVSVTGRQADGTEVPVLRDGRWQL